MARKRKLIVILIYLLIIAAILFMFLYVQKRYGHKPSKKRTEKTFIVAYVDCRDSDGYIPCREAYLMCSQGEVKLRLLR